MLRHGPNTRPETTKHHRRHRPTPRRGDHSQTNTQSRFTCERARAAPAAPQGAKRGDGSGGGTHQRAADNDGAHARTRVAARLAGRGPGGDRIRTDDPLLAKQALSQLSYAPATAAAFADPAIGRPTDRAAWAREDLNLRPHAYQACALTN